MISEKRELITKDLPKTVFVVGGTGLLGSSAIDHLAKNGYSVTAISLPPLPERNPYEDRVEYVAKDINHLSDTEMLRLMKNKTYMLIAIGADERYTPKAPALDFFRKYNVQQTRNLLRLARLAKVKKVVILGSYFTHFNKKWPELELSKTHPYIRSRVEQMEEAFNFNSYSMNVVVLEIPYIFGTVPKRTPLINIIDDQLNSHNHIYYPLGGTAMATAKEVAGAIEGAFLYAQGGKAYPVASVNLKWKDFLSYLLKIKNQQHKKMVAYSRVSTKNEMKRKIKQNNKEGREAGLDLVKYIEFQGRDAYIDPQECMKILKYNPDNLTEAINQTVLECNNQNNKK